MIDGTYTTSPQQEGAPLTVEALKKAMALISPAPPPVRIFESQYATAYKQVRFPRSKKRRIRKKWRKNPDNWATVPTVYWIGMDLCMHPEKMCQFRLELDRRGIADDNKKRYSNYTPFDAMGW